MLNYKEPYEPTQAEKYRKERESPFYKTRQAGRKLFLIAAVIGTFALVDQCSRYVTKYGENYLKSTQQETKQNNSIDDIIKD